MLIHMTHIFECETRYSFAVIGSYVCNSVLNGDQVASFQRVVRLVYAFYIYSQNNTGCLSNSLLLRYIRPYVVPERS